MIDCCASDRQLTRLRGLSSGFGLWCGKRSRERYTVWFTRRQSYHDHAVRKGGEDFSGVSNVAGYIRDLRYGPFNVEFAVVVAVLVVSREIQVKIAHRLKHLPMRFFCNDGFVREVLGFFLPSSKDEPSDFGQGRQRFRIIVSIRTPAPNGMLIQLNGFPFNVAIDHRAQSPISYWQCILPGSA